MKRCLWAMMLVVAVYGGVRAENGKAMETIDRDAAHRSFFVPGWGQWYKGYPARGTCIATAEAAALVGAYAAYASAKDAYRDYQAGNGSYADYNRRVDMTNYLLIAAGFIWAYNVADAYTTKPASGLSLTLGDRQYAGLVYRVEFP